MLKAPKPKGLPGGKAVHIRAMSLTDPVKVAANGSDEPIDGTQRYTAVRILAGVYTVRGDGLRP